MVYANVSTGFKSGGFNGGIIFDPAQVVPFDNEKLLSFEVGTKIGVPQVDLQMNYAAFYYKYSDIQTFTFINSGSIPASVLTNAGDAEIFGIEGDLSWKIDSNFNVNLGFGIISAEYTTFRTAAAFGSSDFTGNNLPLAPEVTLNVGAKYEKPIGNALSFVAQANASYRSKVFFDPANEPLRSQDGYTVVDASISIGASDSNWRITAFAKNLFDKRYLNYVFDFGAFGYNQLFPGMPRQFGARVSANF